MLDTSGQWLFLAIINQQTNQVISHLKIWAAKQHSEITMPLINDTFTQHQITWAQISELYVTTGPGSFTGIRVALTIAKTIGTLTNLKIFTINSLWLLAGKTTSIVKRDAKGGLWYVGVFNHDQIMQPLSLMTNHAYQCLITQWPTYTLIDDTNEIDWLANFLFLKPFFQLITKLADLKATYLKTITPPVVINKYAT